MFQGGLLCRFKIGKAKVQCEAMYEIVQKFEKDLGHWIVLEGKKTMV